MSSMAFKCSSEYMEVVLKSFLACVSQVPVTKTFCIGSSEFCKRKYLYHILEPGSVPSQSYLKSFLQLRDFNCFQLLLCVFSLIVLYTGWVF